MHGTKHRQTEDFHACLTFQGFLALTNACDSSLVQLESPVGAKCDCGTTISYDWLTGAKNQRLRRMCHRNWGNRGPQPCACGTNSMRVCGTMRVCGVPFRTYYVYLQLASPKYSCISTNS